MFAFVEEQSQDCFPKPCGVISWQQCCSSALPCSLFFLARWWPVPIPGPKRRPCGLRTWPGNWKTRDRTHRGFCWLQASVDRRRHQGRAVSRHDRRPGRSPRNSPPWPHPFLAPPIWSCFVVAARSTVARQLRHCRAWDSTTCASCCCRQILKPTGRKRVCPTTRESSGHLRLGFGFGISAAA